MEKILRKRKKFLSATLWSAAIAVAMSGCIKDHHHPNPVPPQNYTQVNLVANTSSFTGARVDPNLINGWGLAFGPSGAAWISSEGAGVSVIYDATGAQLLAPVTIPSPTSDANGAATGQVFNATTDFALTNGNPAKFIFATIDGIISGWNGGAASEKKVDRSGTSVYTGITIGTNGGVNYIYAADFKSAAIDVFDKDFAMVTMTFTDPTLPSGYSPFNIQNVGGQLYVMYAQVDPTTHEEMKGAGLGYVDIFNTDGSFVKRFASQGDLNAPWGIVQAPAAFMGNSDGAILIGNFGDGHINAYDANGNSLGSLKSNGTTISIDGLWGISFAPASATTVDPGWLFFAAGPNDEAAGLFGYLKKD